jgi:membrane protein DedA with SNARE-associated domain
VIGTGLRCRESAIKFGRKKAVPGDERGVMSYNTLWMLYTVIGCLKWAAVGFVVAYFLMKLYEASHRHDDIPKPEFKIRQSRRAALVLSTFAAMLSALVWLLVQKLD